MFLVVYPNRGLVSSGLNMKLYDTLFWLTWIISVPLHCFNALEIFADHYNLTIVTILMSIDVIVVELFTLKMRWCIDDMCLNRQYLSAIGGTKRRNLFTANECRHIAHCAQFCMVLEEALLLGLPISREAVKSVATLGCCIVLSLCMPLKLLNMLKRDPPLSYIHPELTSFFMTTQAFVSRPATIDPPKKLKRDNEENVSSGSFVYLERPKLISSAKRVIFVKPYVEASRPSCEWEGTEEKDNTEKSGMGGSESSSSLRLRHGERSDACAPTEFVSLDDQELEEIRKSAAARNMMRRFEAKIENAKLKLRYPPKITGMPDVCID